MSAYDATSLARRERIEKLKADITRARSRTRRLEGGTQDKGPPGQDHQGIPARRRRSPLHHRHQDARQARADPAGSLGEHASSGSGERHPAAKLGRRAQAQRFEVAPRDGHDELARLRSFRPMRSSRSTASTRRPKSVIASTTGKWQDANDPSARTRSIEALGSIVPRDGTSLINAFGAVNQMSPHAGPDHPHH